MSLVILNGFSAVPSPYCIASGDIDITRHMPHPPSTEITKYTNIIIVLLLGATQDSSQYLDGDIVKKRLGLYK